MRAMGSGGETVGWITAECDSPRPLATGDRWAAEALGRLRRWRCRPAAWIAFIAASLLVVGCSVLPRSAAPFSTPA